MPFKRHNLKISKQFHLRSDFLCSCDSDISPSEINSASTAILFIPGVGFVLRSDLDL